ncbi:hypothetical protein CKM354_001013400 [Cercospora kikuchii]|uniref:Protein HID1 n=1 Tax=Cercospora kikuchii TaxID=84275 RepID=A0A9P3CQG5_9PEZI|nr:uncharacterized protein CKM354_001013400 [Cercospora kikuchii]GIZ47033.1 hypothetical protein CKM354_001013400 [Cercospora kikuchii]
MGVSESKIAFKQSVFKLIGDDVLQPDNDIFAKYWTIPERVDDVFDLWVGGDVRVLTYTNASEPGARKASPGEQCSPMTNLETLLYNAIAQLERLQKDTEQPDELVARQILNCMRILTRVMPFIFEADHLREWYDKFFWQPRKPQFLNWDEKRDTHTQLFDGLDPSKLYSKEDKDKEIGPPLGETLIDLVVDYLFWRGLTLPSQQEDSGKSDRGYELKVWKTGIGCSTSSKCTSEHERNQYEVIRLLLTLTSSTLYLRPDQVALANNKALTYLTTKLEKRVVNAINCSCLNTVLRFNPNLWTIPSGWQGARDTKKLLVLNCIQFLLVTMVYIPPEGKNLFRSSMGALFRPDDFQFIHHGVNLVISQPMTTSNFSIGKSNAGHHATEMISFLWELIQCNKRFRRYLCETKVGMDYLVIFLFYARDSVADETKQGLMRMVIFVIQSLSAEAAFCAKLNTPFLHVSSLPPVMRIENFHGSYADFLICSIHCLITASKGRLEPVYPALFNIIKNVAPYAKHLQRATSSKLVNLFEMLSAPSFCLKNDTNHVILKNLLDACNAILDNHYRENQQFIRVLIASKKHFRALQQITVEGALAEAERQAIERKDRGDVLSPTSHSRGSSIDSMRRPVAPRTPSLANVPEDTRFAIGDDEDEDHEGNENADVDEKADQRASKTPDAGGENRVPTPVRLSEKARGKQPAAVRLSTSRQTSTTSLPTLTPVTTSQNFQPSEQWLESWYTQLPLEPILKVIEDSETRKQDGVSARTSTSSAPEEQHDADVRRATTAEQPGLGREARQSAQLTRQSTDSGRSAQAAYGADGQGHLGTKDNIRPAAGGPVSFQWTAVAIGWYNALIWSRIYLQEAEAFQGSGGLYSSTDIKLFRRQGASQEISLKSPKGAIDAVGASLAQRISSISIPDAFTGGGATSGQTGAGR